MYLQPSVGDFSMDGLYCPGMCIGMETALDPETSTEPLNDASPGPQSPRTDLVVANPYNVLQIRRDATNSEIQRAYKRLALWHHPGRNNDSREERQRRLQVFHILAACYETLLASESRRKYDAFQTELEGIRLKSGLAGEMYVGGNRIAKAPPVRSVTEEARAFLCAATCQENLEELERLPALSHSSSDSSSDEEEQETGSRQLRKEGKPADTSSFQRSVTSELRSLADVVSSECESMEEADFHYTATATARLFGGPLSDLYRARNFEQFRDPFVVFEEVFGSRVFHSLSEVGELDQRHENWVPLRPTCSPGWTGSAEVSPDGTKKVFRTSRVLHDRRLTRVETISTHPVSGKCTSNVSVVAENLAPGGALMDDSSVLVGASGLLFCGMGNVASMATPCKSACNKNRTARPPKDIVLPSYEDSSVDQEATFCQDFLSCGDICASYSTGSA